MNKWILHYKGSFVLMATEIILVFVYTKGFHLAPLRSVQFLEKPSKTFFLIDMVASIQREMGVLRVEVNTDDHGNNIIHPQSAVKTTFIIPPCNTDHFYLK